METFGKLSRYRSAIMGIAMASIVAVALWAAGRQSVTTGKRQIVCTFLPMYVFALNVVGNDPHTEVRMLVPANVGCPHSYSASARDLNLIGHADVIVANGLGAERFLEKALAQKAHATVITLSGDCDVIESRNPTPNHHDHDEHCDHGTVNAHVWVSPAQAIQQVKLLARELARLYPDDALKFEVNGQAYVERLQQLKEEYTQAAQSFERRNIATFHEAFDYLARDLDLNVVTTLTAAPGHTPTAAEMADVIAAIRENDVAAIITEPAYADSDRLAKAISNETGTPVFPLNPFNTITGQPEADSYEAVMRENLNTLSRALGKPI